MEHKFRERSFVRDNGTLVLPRLLMEGVAANLSGREVYITVEDAAEIRSENANAYYWAAIVTPICDRFNELGERFTTDLVHEILKYKFLKVVVPDMDTGEVLVEYVKSTSKLKVWEFSFYLEDCIRYAAEDLELVIEPPKKRRNEYIFPIFSKDAEPREKYIQRIRGYVGDIFTIEHLARFFAQNDEWMDDAEIRAVFTARKIELKALK